MSPLGPAASEFRSEPPKWSVNGEADIGGLDNSATGQALGSVGYNWTPSIATTFGYRVLYTYEKQNTGFARSFRYQQWMYGPSQLLNRLPATADVSRNRRRGLAKRTLMLSAPPGRRARVCPRSAANAHAGAHVTTRGHDRGMHDRDRSMCDDRAARSDASRAIDASRTGGGIGLRSRNGEQAKNQQGGSNIFHRITPHCVFIPKSNCHVARFAMNRV